MGIFDVLKKIFEKEDKTIEASLEKVSLSELHKKIKEEQDKALSESEEIKENLALKVKQFCEELRSHINLLKVIDLKERKEIERLKLLTLENLKVYISHLEQLLQDIEKQRDLPLKQYSDQISSTLSRFEKQAKMSFEKATILIGKELEKTRNTLTGFLSEYNAQLSNNKQFFARVDALQELKKLSTELEELKQKQEEGKLSCDNLKTKKEKLLEHKTQKQKDLEDFVQSEMYQKIGEQRKKEQELLAKQALGLRQKIDFKMLTKAHYGDEHKQSLVKSYREQFLKSLEDDTHLQFLDIIKASSLDEKGIAEIKELHSNLQLLKAAKEDPLESQRKEQERILQSITLELQSIERDLGHEQKKASKWEEQIQAAQEQMRTQAAILRWEIE
jgi:hypothetical protein